MCQREYTDRMAMFLIYSNIEWTRLIFQPEENVVIL